MFEPDVTSNALNLVIAEPLAVFNDAVVDSIDAVIAFNEVMFEVDPVMDEISTPLYVNEPVIAAFCICIICDYFV
jgi:hypothetical protein